MPLESLRISRCLLHQPVGFPRVCDANWSNRQPISGCCGRLSKSRGNLGRSTDVLGANRHYPKTARMIGGAPLPRCPPLRIGGMLDHHGGRHAGCTAPLLERHRVFHSHDAEETRAFLGGKGYQFDLSPRLTRRLNTRINAFYMPSMHLGYMHYGNLPVELCPGLARSDFLLQLPIRGHLSASMGGEGVDSNPSRAVILSPVHERCRFVSSADSTRLHLAQAKSR